MKNKKIWFSLKAPKAALKNLYMLPGKGFSAFYNPHLMQPFLKSTLEEVWKEEEPVLDETCSHIVQSEKPRGKFFSIGNDDAAIKDAVLGHKYKTVCLSDDDVNYDFEKEQAFLLGILEETLPEKSSFEK